MVTHLKEAIGGSADLSSGKYRAMLIKADAWGSSAYYSSEVLERDGARVFHKGLHMNQDHLTEAEQWERPEGSVANLVGVLESDAEFDASGPEGSGLYGDVKFYPSYVQRISELKEDVGLSVDAQGITEQGERDGRFGPVLVGLLSAKSVDVVTKAGAGGKLMHMIESDRGLAGRPIESKEQSMTDVTKEDFEALVAKFDALPTLIADALKTVATGTPAEVTATEVVAGAETAAVTSTDTSAVTDTTHEAEVDLGHIVEALRDNNLPGKVAGAVVTAIKGGKSEEDAIAEQVALREAFIETSAEKGSVHIQESGKPTGLARAVTVLK